MVLDFKRLPTLPGIVVSKACWDRTLKYNSLQSRRANLGESGTLHWKTPHEVRKF